MTGNIIARRYAQALFALGKKTGLPELEDYAASLADMRFALTASGDLARVFDSPVFTTEEKKKVIEALAKKFGVKGAILNFWRLLADKNRLAELPAITAVFGEMLDAEKGILRGALFTAIELAPEKQAEVTGQLEKKAKRALALEFGVDPEILGGVVLKLGDRVLDASLRAQLSILKDTIKKGE